MTALALLIAGCSSTGPEVSSAARGAPGESESRLLVVASTTVLADLVAAAVGSLADVRSIVPPSADPHGYEPSPSDARSIASADLVVVNGLGLEPWFDALVGTQARVLRVGEEVAAGMDDVDVELRDVQGQTDPHLWMLPLLAAEYVKVVASSVAEMRPEHERQLLLQAEEAARALSELDVEIEQVLARIPQHRRIIVTTHDSQGYFAQRFGFEVLTLVGVSTEETPSARQQRRVIDAVRDQGVPTVFLEEHVAPMLARAIARDSGASVGGILYGDSLVASESEEEGPKSYVEMLRWNARVLVAGLAPEAAVDAAIDTAVDAQEVPGPR